MCYFKENKENPKELVLKNRINLPYEPGTDEEEIEEVMQAHKEFVPSRLVTSSIYDYFKRDLYRIFS